MNDFKMSNLFVWKNTKKHFYLIIEDKRKLAVISLVMFSVFSAFLIVIVQLKMNQLEEARDKTQLELLVLKQSAGYSKELELKENKRLRELEKRVERIISTGEDADLNSVLGISEIKSEIEEKSKSIAQQQSVSNSNFSGVTREEINQDQVEINSLGKLEVFDTSRKEVYIYKDASTISQVISTIEVGEVVDFYKKSSGWYLVKSDNELKEGWLSEKNVRLVKNDE